ncbi:restriction endonuclease subunit S [Shewanella oncorhynchi]|uniref:restriction endonuclease subunit S n=1 Tax=Shewanella oncorhynchi TaxID=2726434 RepID=UPI003D7A78B8
MSQLPKGWVGCKLGDVVDYGKTVKAVMTNIDNDAWILELEDLEKDSSKILQRVSFGERKPKSAKNAFKAGDVLYGKLRPYLNKIVIAPEDGICTSEIIPLKVPTGLVDNRFLFYWLKGRVFGDYVNAVSYGVNMPRLGTKDGSNAPMVLAPTTEQKRIVAKLDEVLAQVDIIKARLDRIPAILKRFRQSVLAAAVSGKLTEEWREDKIFDLDKEISQIDKNRIELYLKDNAEHFEKTGKSIRKYDYSTLKEDPEYRVIPNSWKLVQLGEIISFLTDYHANGSYEVLKEHVELKETEDYACMIRATNFEKNNFEDLFVFISQDAYEFLSKSKLYGNEILVGKIGNAGSVYLMPQLGRPASLAMNLFALRFDESLVSPEYVYMFLKSSIGEKNIQKYVRGVATKSIDKKSLRSVFINYPPREEQTEIVRLVDQYFAFADTIEAQVKKAQARVDNLTQSILAKAFRGELVAQDPNDEPADKLLERIAQARTEAEALAKTAKKLKQ